MPANKKHEIVNCSYFSWRFHQRHGVWQADGRSNSPCPGRHSLGTKNRDEALKNLNRLDLVQAVKTGLADEAILHADRRAGIPLDEGVKLYLDHVGRPRVTGGAKPKTVGRYRVVLEKAVPFFQKVGIVSWNHVKKYHLENYAAWLDGEGYAYRTEFLELTTLKQIIKYLIADHRLPADCQIDMPLPKPTGTDTYCWRPLEVQAIIQHCRKQADLTWLADALTALACTGVRISELSAMRFSDVDFASNTITLKDETKSKRQKGREARSIKNSESRSFPIHKDLRALLESLRTRDRGSHVFSGPDGELLKPDLVRRALISRVLMPLADRFPSEKDTVGFKDGRLHSFRHYFCSVCAASGTPERVLMRWVGHKNSAMVETYFHLHDGEAQRQMEKLNPVRGFDAS
jgi:integrase